ncbi:hypothetical_protein [Candidozyma auris]|uniref:hypothetical_protein n=1 Tax=Candidozyma auris TaxID=498019 RepID=UPI00125781A6|nr:hypothetical_protein [[Candida] auris]QEO23422.1 hypothetical_protein [[Candida] auris]
MTKAYATLLHGEDYVPGALTLAKTLLKFGTKAKLAILLDKSSLSKKSVDLIENTFHDVVDISETSVSASVEKVAEKLGRKELAITFSKILLWNLTNYDQIVFLDSDTLPLKPLDSLLPFLYNVTPSAHYQYNPALERFRDQIRLVHFIGASKPWHTRYEGNEEFRSVWWKHFDEFFSDEATRIHLLSRPQGQGEAHLFKFTKLVNAWDTDEEQAPSLENLNISSQPPKKIFPWEEREQVEPTRVWEPVSLARESGGRRERRVSLDGNTEARVSSIGSGRSLRRASNQFKDETGFNPEKSLEEVSKMPLKFLQSKRSADEGGTSK